MEPRSAIATILDVVFVLLPVVGIAALAWRSRHAGKDGAPPGTDADADAEADR